MKSCINVNFTEYTSLLSRTGVFLVPLIYLQILIVLFNFFFKFNPEYMTVI